MCCRQNYTELATLYIQVTAATSFVPFTRLSRCALHKLLSKQMCRCQYCAKLCGQKSSAMRFSGLECI